MSPYKSDRALVTTSTEFINLCQSQAAWLQEGLGARKSAIYVTKDLEAGTQELVPVVVYPEADSHGAQSGIEAIASLGWGEQLAPSGAQAGLLPPAEDGSGQSDRSETSLRPYHQLVLPLIHEETMLGLLVAGRDDRDWDERERAQIERAASTLTFARILDRRQECYRQQLLARDEFQASQRDRLDDWLHQLRNPLTALRTFSKLLLNRFRDESEHAKERQIASNILRESDRLRDLLQQMDDSFEKTPTPALQASEGSRRPTLLPAQLECQPLAVSEVLEPLVQSTAAIARERELTFGTDIPPSLPPVRGNGQALQEILSNLLDNALKYTPSGGEIYIHAGLERENAAQPLQGIAISDSGPGIPESDRDRIFERRYRGVQASGSLPGTGLGLAIARELVEQMEGKIEAISPTNRQQQRGTTFIVWLPCAARAK